MAVAASAVWRIRPNGANTNGGGYDSASYPGGTDYSQQDAAQASGTHGSGAGTTTFTDSTAGAFTAAMVGNCINIAGQGFYFVVSRTDANNVVVDRALGTFSGASWALGGGWGGSAVQSIAGNITSGTSPVVPGNIVYILGSRIPNPASYTYDYTMNDNLAAVSGSSSGTVHYLADPATPSYDGTLGGGVPVIQNNGHYVFNSVSNAKFMLLWVVQTTNSLGITGTVVLTARSAIMSCVIDHTTTDTRGISYSGGDVLITGCELFSSTAGASSHTYEAVRGTGIVKITDCNVHDWNGPGIYTGSDGTTVERCVVAKNTGAGIQVGDASLIANNTVDANTGNGMEFLGQLALQGGMCVNNYITNHTGAGTYGMTVDAGTTAANDLIKSFIDYNKWYGNTTDVNAISKGAHDTTLGSTPYVNSATENYTPVSP
jgi:hypothetical protein